MSYLYEYLKSVCVQLGIFGSAYLIVDAFHGSTMAGYAIYIAILSSFGVLFFHYLVKGKDLRNQSNRCVHGVDGSDCYDCYVTYVENKKL